MSQYSALHLRGSDSEVKRLPTQRHAMSSPNGKLAGFQHLADQSHVTGNIQALKNEAGHYSENHTSPVPAKSKGTPVQSQSAALQLARTDRKGNNRRSSGKGRHDKGTRDNEWRRATFGKKKPKKHGRAIADEELPVIDPRLGLLAQQQGVLDAPQEQAEQQFLDDEFSSEEDDVRPALFAREPAQHPRERNVSKRVQDKALGGRTFSDTFNTIGGVGSVIEDKNTGFVFSVISGIGVFTSGAKIFYSSLRMKPRDGHERLEQALLVAVGLANMVSGITAIESGILGLCTYDDIADGFGNTSLLAMATAECSNAMVQLNSLHAEYQDQETNGYSFHTIFALLESVLKVIGPIMMVAGVKNPGAIVMLLGTAGGMLHGIIKLIYLCQQSSGNETDDDQQFENTHEMV